jgi:hypothetical protein
MEKTLELIVQELQNRMGQLVSNYETQLAVLKAQATEALEEKDNKIKELTNKLVPPPTAGEEKK